MRSGTRGFGAAAALALMALPGLLASPALAHPHVVIDARARVVFDAAGQVAALRHAWTFDEMFSAFATQGLPMKSPGKPTREELADLAKVNVESMAEFDYFSVLKAAGRKAAFGEPTDYWLDFADGRLTLNYTLPLKQPAPGRTLSLEVFDPSYYVAFGFQPAEPVVLEGAPAGCTASVRRPDAGAADKARALGEAFFGALAGGADFGASIANRAVVTCP